MKEGAENTLNRGITPLGGVHFLTLARMIAHVKRRSEMTNSRSLSQKFILLSVLMVFGMALFSGCASITGKTAGENIDDATITTKVNGIIVNEPDAHYWKIDVTTTKGDVMLTGFVNSKEAEERLVEKIRQIRGVKSVKSFLKVEEKK